MWNSSIFLAYCQHFWDLPLLLRMCVQLGILVVFSDHSPFLFSLLHCFWGSWSRQQAHSCINKAAAHKIPRLYKLLLLLKQSFQSNLRGQKGFHMPEPRVVTWQKVGRLWWPHWGHDPSLPFAGLSQRTLSPMGQGWHPLQWDNRRGSLRGLARYGVQGNNVLGCNKLRGCYGEESEVAKGRNHGGLENNE